MERWQITGAVLLTLAIPPYAHMHYNRAVFIRSNSSRDGKIRMNIGSLNRVAASPDELLSCPTRLQRRLLC